MSLPGARALDDRRRRRLALESERDCSEPVTARESSFESSKSDGQTEATRLTISLPAIVPTQAWKVWTLGMACLAPLVGLSLAWLFAEEAAQAGSDLGSLIAPLAERVLTGAGAAVWLLAAQLSGVIWWVRSRSQFDYSGRFSAWGWTSAGLLVAALCCLTNGHRFVAQLLAWSVSGFVTSDSIGFTAAWLMPTLAIGMAVWATTASELRDCFPSRLVHGFSAGLGLTMLGLEIWAARTGSSMRLEFASRSLLVILQWSNLMTLLLHLRHVVHVTPDPPQARPALLTGAWSATLGRVLSMGVGWLVAPLSKLAARWKTRTASASGGKRHIELSDEEGEREVRIDEAEVAAKGPTRRMKAAVRK